jgi:hypothetical protein
MVMFISWLQCTAGDQGVSILMLLPRAIYGDIHACNFLNIW